MKNEEFINGISEKEVSKRVISRDLALNIGF